jgi:hypothetical protein
LSEIFIGGICLFAEDKSINITPPFEKFIHSYSKGEVIFEENVTDNEMYIVYSSVVGLTMFAMVATDTEHPPACGTALGVAISGWSLSVTLTILVSAIILAAAHVALARFLKDLV